MTEHAGIARAKEVRGLGAILLLAFLLRFAGLDSNPPGLFRDEADKGYSTYSLLQTGKDLDGRFFPLQIKSFNAYTSPLYHWFSLPVIGLFGLTVTSVRLVAALAGTLACGAVYLLGREWFGTRGGLFSALLLAVSPWHILFSRWANQGILMTLFVPLAFYYTTRTLEKDRTLLRAAILASFFWALAWASYAPSRLFVPLLLFAMVALAFVGAGNGFLRGRTVFLIGAGTVVFLSPFLYDIFATWDETQTRLKFLAGEEPFSIAGFAQNYLLHWDPRYLVLWGDANPRHHGSTWPLMGQITWVEGIGLGLGLWAIFRTKMNWRYGWLLAWILLAPVPAAVTREGLPHALRTLMIVPGFALLGGLGLDALIASAAAGKNTGVRFLAAGAVALQTAVCLASFWADYPKESALFWEAGFVEAIETVRENRREGETVLVSGMVEFPEATFQFVLRPDPDRVQEGSGLEGVSFLPTGTPFEFKRHDRAGLILLRPGEVRKPPWWEEVRPAEEDSAMDDFWYLYRSKGVSGN